MKLLIFSEDDKLHDYSQFARALEKFSIETTCLSSSKTCFISQNIPFNRIPSPKMLGAIKRFKPDVIFTETPYYIPYFAKLVSRLVILHMRFDVWNETDVDRGTYPSFSARTYTNYLSKIKEPSIKKADMVLLNSKWLQNQFQKHLPNIPNRVLYVGINSGEWPTKSNKSTPSSSKTLDIKHPAVAAIFQLNQYRKVLGLLKFFKVIGRLPDVNFYFAGSGPYLDLIKEKSLPSNLFLLGRLEKFEVKLLLEQCDIFVHPSGLDALPRSVKEASLLAKPIVASNIGGIPEIVKNEETGYLCDINNIDQWVEKIRFLIDNPAVANKFGKNARRYVEETFDWNKIAESFIDSIETLQDRI